MASQSAVKLKSIIEQLRKNAAEKKMTYTEKYGVEAEEDLPDLEGRPVTKVGGEMPTSTPRMLAAYRMQMSISKSCRGEVRIDKEVLQLDAPKKILRERRRSFIDHDATMEDDIDPLTLAPPRMQRRVSGVVPSVTRRTVAETRNEHKPKLGEELKRSIESAVLTNKAREGLETFEVLGHEFPMAQNEQTRMEITQYNVKKTAMSITEGHTSMQQKRVPADAGDGETGKVPALPRILTMSSFPEIPEILARDDPRNTRIVGRVREQKITKETKPPYIAPEFFEQNDLNTIDFNHKKMLKRYDPDVRKIEQEELDMLGEALHTAMKGAVKEEEVVEHAYFFMKHNRERAQWWRMIQLFDKRNMMVVLLVYLIFLVSTVLSLTWFLTGKESYFTLDEIKSFSASSVITSQLTTNNRVVLIVVSGLSDALKSRSSYTTFKNTFSADLVELSLNAAVPTIGPPNWHTMLSGAPPSYTGYLVNRENESRYDTIFHRMKSMGVKSVNLGNPTFQSMLKSGFAHLETDRTFVYGNAKNYDGNNRRKSMSDHGREEMLDYIVFDKARKYVADTQYDFVTVFFRGLDWNGHYNQGGLSTSADFSYMDTIFTTYITSLTSLLDTNTVLMITSDHGMAVSGGHGGSTSRLKEIPLILYKSGSGLASSAALSATYSYTRPYIGSIAPSIAAILGVQSPLQNSHPPLNEAMILVDTGNLQTATREIYNQMKQMANELLGTMTRFSTEASTLLDEVYLSSTYDTGSLTFSDYITATNEVRSYIHSAERIYRDYALTLNAFMCLIAIIPVAILIVCSAQCTTSVDMRRMMYPNKRMSTEWKACCLGLLTIIIFLLAFSFGFLILIYSFGFTVQSNIELYGTESRGAIVICVLAVWSVLSEYIAVTIVSVQIVKFSGAPNDHRLWNWLRERITLVLRPMSSKNINERKIVLGYLVWRYSLMWAQLGCLFFLLINFGNWIIFPGVHEVYFMTDFMWQAWFYIIHYQMALIPLLVGHLRLGTWMPHKPSTWGWDKNMDKLILLLYDKRKRSQILQDGISKIPRAVCGLHFLKYSREFPNTRWLQDEKDECVESFQKLLSDFKNMDSNQKALALLEAIDEAELIAENVE